MRYRKKPVVVEAIRWSGDNFKECVAFLADARVAMGESAGLYYRRTTASADQDLMFWCEKSQAFVFLAPDGWIIAEPDGIGFYPCTAEDFNRTYEAA